VICADCMKGQWEQNKYPIMRVTYTVVFNTAQNYDATLRDLRAEKWKIAKQSKTPGDDAASWGLVIITVSNI